MSVISSFVICPSQFMSYKEKVQHNFSSNVPRDNIDKPWTNFCLWWRKEREKNNTLGTEIHNKNGVRQEGVNIIWYSTHQSSTGLDSIMIAIYSISETLRHYRFVFQMPRELRQTQGRRREKKLRTSTAQSPKNNLQSCISASPLSTIIDWVDNQWSQVAEER